MYFITCKGMDKVNKLQLNKHVLHVLLTVTLSSRSAIDDKRRRLRAFLTCMRSDTPLMLNPAYVPQHLLVMASVLRYVDISVHYMISLNFTDSRTQTTSLAWCQC
jgi:hypothetical protein